MVIWRIKDIKYDDNNVIVFVNWECFMDSNTKYVRTEGDIHFDSSDIDKNNFIPYEDITEDIVIDWIKSKLGNEQIANTENHLFKKTQKMSQLKNMYSGLPWELNDTPHLAKQEHQEL